MSFLILARDVVIGTTEFEFGDPPMGVARGRLHPSDLYSEVRAKILDAQDESSSARSISQRALSKTLRAETRNGTRLEPCSHVFITDLGDDGDADVIEVTICGLDGDLYTRLFSAHREDYERRFGTNGP